MADPYAALKAHFDKVPGVTVNAGRGAQGLKLGKKMFAMFYKGDLLLTLPPERVVGLVDAGRGLPFDPGTGSVMKNRVLIPAAKKRSWTKLCEEAAAAFGGAAAKGAAPREAGAPATKKKAAATATKKKTPAPATKKVARGRRG